MPVARVAVDMSLAHLDRPFDYLVPAECDESVVPGSRVRVRFAGQLVDGYVLARAEQSEHPGKLAFLQRAVSAEAVLSSEIAAVARQVADRYAGTLADVLRLAIPPRHARAEAVRTEPATGEVPEPDPAGWSRYETGAQYLGALADGRAPRAVWGALAGDDWPARLAEAAAACVRSGRGAVLVVPDQRDLDRLDAALTSALGPDRHVSLSAALGPESRYRRWLRASRGHVPVVAGTRAAAFAPVHNVGLLAIWDDGDDLHNEPRAPYPHARQVLLTRAQHSGAAVLVGAYGRTAEAQLLLESGWAHELAGSRATVRAATPRVVPVGDERDMERDAAAVAARLPTVAWQAARKALADGAPVLVQVPRRGYLPSMACERCRAPARCSACAGPLALSSGHAVPSCRWCGRLAGDWTCPECSSRRLRAAVIGARRTAEELGRAFAGTAVRTSGRDGVIARVPHDAALVIATPGAEPVADGGYGAALLLDSWALLTRADLRAAEETLRRWANAAALVRSTGTVVVHADGTIPVVQALLRWDPGWHAAAELADRTALGFPPAVRMASLTGRADAVADLLQTARLPEGAETLGPVPASEDDDTERTLVRVRRGQGPALADALRQAAGVRSARKAPDPVRVQIDPTELL
ncbi:primosomal protein N' [Fodinicola acaciae]|uniref:primosomal protein N' n=1 Tax=Fodinicola acaciae TaxID=2681555 RepID=UPI002483597B|nr:primosomal protein N' [Fodinicola acaciae]